MSTATKTTGKSKRVRYVWDTQMIAHLWANQSQSSARNSQGNFYFDGPTIYSYGRHFPIATLHVRKGKTIVLLNPSTYSNTTAKHCNLVRGASRQFTQVEVPSQGTDLYYSKLNHKENLTYFAKQIESLTESAMAGRLGRDWRRVDEQVESANAYCEFWGLRTRFTMPDSQEIRNRREWQAQASARHEIKQNERRERDRAIWEQRQRDNLLSNEEKIAKWRNGESIDLPYSCRSPIMLRIRGSRVETSQGAIVELSSAMQLLPFVRSGKEWQRNGQTMQIGDFQLDRIDELGNVEIGCHHITREEIERLAASLGL